MMTTGLTDTTAVPFRFHLATQDTSELEAVNAIGSIPLEFHCMDREPVLLRLSGVKSGSLGLWRTTSTTGFQVVPKCTAEVMTLRFPLTGSVLRRDRQEELACKPGSGLIAPFDGMQHMRSSHNVDMLGCTISLTALHQCQEQLDEKPAAAPVGFQAVAETRTKALKGLVLLIEKLHTRLTMSDRDLGISYPLIEEMLIFQLIGAWPSSIRDRARPPLPSTRSVRTAVDYIEKHLAEPIKVSDVARRSNVSVRALQLGFQTQLGCSPVNYILNRRLEHVHDELVRLDHPEYVSQIAYRWGFRHMGDFARRYQQKYGEAPSTTRKLATGS